MHATAVKGGIAIVLLLAATHAGAATETREAAGFDRVMFGLPGTLTLEEGEFAVVIEAADEDLERIESRVSSGELLLRVDEGWFGRSDRLGDVRVQVTMPSLRAVDVSGSGNVVGGAWLAESLAIEVHGSGNVEFQQVTVEDLHIEIAGSGSVAIDKVDAATARLEIRGSGDVKLAGAADAQEIEVMGSGDVDAEGLEGSRVEIEIMGSGDVTAWATDSLDAVVMGSGDIRYRGTPRVDHNSMGPGRIRPM